MSGEHLPGASPISVVIATLGGDWLKSTIDWLNEGDHPPAEILICIPEAEAPRVRHLAGGNVRILITQLRGQVAQRAEGFREARQRLVLQLDDDMWIRQSDVGRLVAAVDSLGPGHAVAPVYLDKATGLGIHRQFDGMRGFLQSLNATLLAGAPWGTRRMGKVTDIGTNFGVDPARASAAVVAMEWLPGGCVMHHRESLVLEPFFPYPGKAYCEDLIHSHLLRTRGVRLRVVRDASIRCDGFALPTDWRGIRAEARARLYFVRLRGLVPVRFWAWLGVSILKRSLAFLLRRFAASARSSSPR